MAVSIDNVYQKVLALANKEQRGYITPQEFNLLADKAQNDIFEMYFHEYKTSLLSPGNQSKTADDIDMLREKISLHRVVGGALGSSNTSIPTNAHWLESVYRSSIGKRSITIKFDTAWSSDHDTNNIQLRAIYDGTGNQASGEGIYNIILNHDGSDVAGAYVSTNGALHVDVTGSASAVAEKVTKAINDNSPYHTATATGDTITLTYNTTGYTWTGAEALSTGSGTSASTLMTLGTPTTSVTEQTVYEQVDKDDWTYIKSNKKLNPTTNSRGIFYRYGASGVELLPSAGTDTVLCDYIRSPAKPNWGYVVVGDKALYNSSASTDFDLHASEESTLTNKILELAGIVINKPGLSEVILRNEAVKEANENK
jgi:hypothetical protein